MTVRQKQLLQAAVAAVSLVLAAQIAHLMHLERATGLLCITSLASLVAMMRLGWRQTLLGLLALTLLSVPALFSHSDPLLATAVMATTAMGLGLSARWQLMPSFWLMVVGLCLLITNSPVSATPSASELISVISSELAAGAVAALLQNQLVPGLAKNQATDVLPVVHSWRRSAAYGLMLAGATLITTPVALIHLGPTAGFWLIITPFLVIRPFVKEGYTLALHRSLGTLAGVILVVAIAMVLPRFIPLQLPAIAAGVITALIAAKGAHRAWMLTAFTVAIVFFNSNHADLVLIADKRLLASALGISIALAITAVAYPIEQRLKG